ncbi:hypothetical protein ACLOJK_038259 [Asimina triloba]
MLHCTRKHLYGAPPSSPKAAAMAAADDSHNGSIAVNDNNITVPTVPARCRHLHQRTHHGRTHDSTIRVVHLVAGVELSLDPVKPQADEDHNSEPRQACLLHRRRAYIHPAPIRRPRAFSSRTHLTVDSSEAPCIKRYRQQAPGLGDLGRPSCHPSSPSTPAVIRWPSRLPAPLLPSSSTRTTTAIFSCSQCRPLNDELYHARTDPPRMHPSIACLFDVGKVGIGVVRSQEPTPTTDLGRIDGATIATIKSSLLQ